MYQKKSTDINKQNGISERPSVSGISLGMGPANKRRRYNVTTSLIGWAHTYTDAGYMNEIIYISIYHIMKR